MTFISCLFTFYQNHAPTMSLSDKHNPFCLKASYLLTDSCDAHTYFSYFASRQGPAFCILNGTAF